MLTTNQELKNIYSQHFDSFSGKGSELIKMSSHSSRVFNEDAHEVGTIRDVQNVLRPIFNKSGTVTPSIGGHPDYDHLRELKTTEFGSTTTLFMDIESSTRLGILYSPEDVFKIKNTFIRMAIDVIKSLDGHVHRIMGDAVMAYFGRKDLPDENGVVDALNCASVLMYIVKNSVIPKLEEEGFTNSEFGIRIGVDYGPEQHVLWSSYGHHAMDEVTATSYFVDVASKLQSSAGRNQIMLGQSLVEFIDFYDGLLDIKKMKKNGVYEDDPFIRPNVTDKDGNKINYRKFHLKWEDYLKKTPFPIESTCNDNYLPVVTNSFSIRVDVYNEDKTVCEGTYAPGSFFLDKDKYLKFVLNLHYLPQFPYTVKFKVENHGEQASKFNNNDNHEIIKTIESSHQHKEIINWEYTQYRGIHYMIIEISSATRLLHRIPFAIYVK